MPERNIVTLPDSDRGLRTAVGLLRAGKLVAFPTETVYGLGREGDEGAGMEEADRDAQAAAAVREGDGVRLGHG